MIPFVNFGISGIFQEYSQDFKGRALVASIRRIGSQAFLLSVINYLWAVASWVLCHVDGLCQRLSAALEFGAFG